MSSLNLKKIASKLESLEESIIFRLIDRVQQNYNKNVYNVGIFSFDLDGEETSLLNHKLLFLEKTDSILGRYTIAEERPFFANLPKPEQEVTIKESELHLNDYGIINLGIDIRTAYEKLLPKITESGDSGNYGTTAEIDISTLQAIARRIHYGSCYVAESKYSDNPKGYDKLINSKDESGLMKLLTRQDIEDKIIERIRHKTEIIQSISNPDIRKKLDSNAVAQFYFDTIIPLTKVGEIKYLMNRIR